MKNRTLGKAKSYSTREIVRILLDNGYELDHIHGSHRTYIRQSDGDKVVVNKNVNKMVARRLLYEHHLVID